jgi:hypothetical protein
LASSAVRRFFAESYASRVEQSSIAIARRLDVALITLDRRLANAAQALGITVEMPQTS